MIFRIKVLLLQLNFVLDFITFIYFGIAHSDYTETDFNRRLGLLLRTILPYYLTLPKGGGNNRVD